jgi:hypothetical protein
MKKFLSALSIALTFCAGQVLAADVTVSASNNSTSGGTGATALTLTAGQTFTVSVDTGDLWNAGALPRWSNADGLTHDLFWSPGIDSQVPVYPVGTPIGTLFPLWVQGGLSAPYGSLVGQIGSGNFFTIGTNYSGSAATAGTLSLFYFDSNNSDNTGSILAHVTAVPEPETYVMMMAGLGLLGFVGRRKKNRA